MGGCTVVRVSAGTRSSSPKVASSSSRRASRACSGGRRRARNWMAWCTDAVREEISLSRSDGAAPGRRRCHRPPPHGAEAAVRIRRHAPGARTDPSPAARFPRAASATVPGRARLQFHAGLSQSAAARQVSCKRMRSICSPRCDARPSRCDTDKGWRSISARLAFRASSRGRDGATVRRRFRKGVTDNPRPVSGKVRSLPVLAPTWCCYACATNPGRRGLPTFRTRFGARG